MENKKQNRSVNLSFIACYFAFFCIVAVGLCAPQLFKFYFEDYRGIKLNQDLVNTVLYAYYPSAVMGILALFSLLKILKRIKKENPFCIENVNSLKNIYICCFTVSIVTLLAGFFYIPLLIFSGITAFLGVILRVVKNLMQSATEIKAENDLTV